MRYSIRTMRRWGIGWWSIAKCVAGFHSKIDFKGFCPRCEEDV